MPQHTSSKPHILEVMCSASFPYAKGIETSITNVVMVNKYQDQAVSWYQDAGKARISLRQVSSVTGQTYSSTTLCWLLEIPLIPPERSLLSRCCRKKPLGSVNLSYDERSCLALPSLLSKHFVYIVPIIVKVSPHPLFLQPPDEVHHQVQVVLNTWAIHILSGSIHCLLCSA